MNEPTLFEKFAEIIRTDCPEAILTLAQGQIFLNGEPTELPSVVFDFAWDRESEEIEEGHETLSEVLAIFRERILRQCEILGYATFHPPFPA
jgi:hypothetical protein